MIRIQAISARPFSSRMFRVGHELLWVGLGQAIGALGAIVGVRILTQILSPTAYGELALGLTAATLANQVLLGPLGGAALRFFTSARDSGDLAGYFAALRRLLALATGVLVLVMCIGVVGLSSAGNGWAVPLLITALIYALLSNYSSVLDGMQNAARQRVVVAWHDGIAPWLRYALAAMLIWLVTSSSAASAAAMSGYALASAIVLMSQAWFFHRRIFNLDSRGPASVESRAAWISRLTEYAWPFATFGIFTWAQLVSDRWALQAFSSTAAVGQYAVLFQLGYYPASMAAAVFIQLVTPVLFERAGDASSVERLRHSRGLNTWLVFACLAITVIASLTASIAHRWIFQFVVAPAYRSVSSLLPWIVLTAGLSASGQVASLGLMSSHRTRQLVFPRIVSAIVGIGLNIVGAMLFGVHGVVAGGVMFGVLYLAWNLRLLHYSQPAQ